MISTLIALPYELTRLPLAVVDRSVSTRLSETSTVRVTLDRAIGTSDRIAGGLLHNASIRARGTERLDCSASLLRAEQLDDEARARRETARDVAEAGRREAAEKRKAATQQAASAPAEARRTEEQGKQKAAADAAATAAEKKKAADEKAAARTETVERRKKRTAAAAEATKAAARRDAKEGLQDARESQEAAAEARSDAEVLSDVAKAKKQERQQD
ncbi:hypothetical protein [Aeromicrobium sp. Leaf350]|uniref:hypothetical protein n=1 Tax=Aeromicrobium sp. Leaf350 TaxID=2876565 RepID=UPI001E423C47|nr:hypothetical protein [Aeromicrobium sp. Leaf350]